MKKIQNLFIIAILFSTIGSQLITNVIIFDLVAGNKSTYLIFFLKNVYVIPLFIIPFLGSKLEKFDSFKVIIYMDLISAITSIIFLLFLFFKGGTTLDVIIYLLLVSILNSIKLGYEIKFFSKLNIVFKEDLLPKYFSSQLFGSLITPTISIFVYNSFDAFLEVAIAVDSLSFLFLFITMLKLKKYLPKLSAEGKSTLKNNICLKSHITKKKNLNILFFMTLSMSSMILLYGGYIFTVYINGYSLEYIANVMTFSTIGGFIGNYIYNKWIFKKTKIMITLITIIFTLVLLAYLTRSTNILLYTLVSISIAYLNLVFINGRQYYIPADLTVRLNLLIKNIIIISGLTSQLIYIIDMRSIFIIIYFIFICSLLTLYFNLRRMK